MSKRPNGYSAEITRKLVGVTYRQLVYWDTTGLIRPSVEKAKGRGSRRVYSFEDLVELRVIQRLLAAGVTLKAVRKAAHYVRKNFASVTRPLACLALVVDGKKILVKTLDNRALIDATASGQVMINFAVKPIADAVRNEVQSLSASRDLAVKVRSKTYTAVLTPDLVAGGYAITIQELPHVFTEAETVTEARAMVREAVALWLDEEASQPLKKAR